MDVTEDKIGQRIDGSPVLTRLVRYCVDTILAVFAAFVIWRGDYGLRFWIGITLAAIGIPPWVLARIQLGSSFSVGSQARRLITTGLYSKFRHPIYLFYGIGSLGLLIALGNWIVLALFLAVSSFQIPRIRREEKVLEAAFGESYRRYKATTWF
jgi:protein-S-isoprenylcysteine O-methyltransferase Ste14